jgi:hypothetical protein
VGEIGFFIDELIVIAVIVVDLAAHRDHCAAIFGDRRPRLRITGERRGWIGVCIVSSLPYGLVVPS